jgi:hypothetical protein
MDLPSPTTRELAHELAIEMVALDAQIVRVRRAVPANHPLGRPLRDLDESLARPVALARHLMVAVGEDHDSSHVRVRR